MTPRERDQAEAIRVALEELALVRAENAILRAALKPIIARIEMPRNGCSHTQDVMIQASELEALQAALRSGDEKGLIR